MARSVTLEVSRRELEHLIGGMSVAIRFARLVEVRRYDSFDSEVAKLTRKLKRKLGELTLS